MQTDKLAVMQASKYARKYRLGGKQKVASENHRTEYKSKQKMQAAKQESASEQAKRC